MTRNLKRLASLLGSFATGVFSTSCTRGSSELPGTTRTLAGGALDVRVIAHIAETPTESVPCWTYVSTGMLARAQKELALTVAREPGETSPPSDPFEFMEMIWTLANAGRTVDVGGFTKLSQGGFAGRAEYQGFIYVPAQTWIGVTLEAPTLHAVPVTGDEIDAAMSYGALRILGEIGLAHRAFPTAVWMDRRRAALRTPEATKRDSLLGKVTTGRVSGLLVTQVSPRAAMQPIAEPQVAGDVRVDFVEPEVVVSIPMHAARAIGEGFAQLEVNKIVALLGDVDPDGRASFVWTPGKRAPDVIGFAGHDSQRISLNALVLLSVADTGNTSTFFEDSAGFTLDDATWEAMRQALTSGQPLHIPTTGYFSALRIEWRPQLGDQSPASSSLH